MEEKKKIENFFVIPYEEEKEIVITSVNEEVVRLTKKQALLLIKLIQDCIKNW